MKVYQQSLPTKDAPPAAQIHVGFWTVWATIRVEVLQLLKDARQKHPGYDVIFTGHSLGGAVATLAAVDFVSEGLVLAKDVKLMTLGKPRVGNTAFVRHVQSLELNLIRRIVSENDVVPHLVSSRSTLKLFSSLLLIRSFSLIIASHWLRPRTQ
jgi:predicted lipase